MINNLRYYKLLQLYKSNKSTLISSAILVFIFTTMQFLILSDSGIFIWSFCMLLIIYIRWRNWKRFFNTKIDKSNLDFNWKKFEAFALINGLGWGLTAIFFFPVENSIAQIITIFFIAGLSSGSITINAIEKNFAHKFLIIILSPLVTSFLFISLPYSYLLSIIILLYLGFLFKISNDLSKVYENEFKTSISNNLKEKQLVSAQSKLDLAKEFTGIGLAERNLNDIFFTVDRTWAKLLGYTKDEINPFNKELFNKLIYQDDTEIIKDYFSDSEKVIRNLGKDEIRLKNKKGEWLILETGSRIIQVENNTVEIRTLSNITDHKNREGEIREAKNNLELYTNKLEQNSKELELLNKQLKEAFIKIEKADNAKSRFFSNLSNDLMLPMEGVLDISKLLSDSDISPHQKTYIEIIKNSITLSHTLIQDLLYYAENGTYKLEINYGKYNLRNLVSEIIEIFTSLLIEKKINLNYMVDNDVPIEFITDRIRLQQILFNIIGNAISATDTGGISVKVSVDNSIDGKLSVYFIISDSGKGTSDKIKETLSQFAVDTHNLSLNNDNELNIGLCVTKQLVEFMEGSLSVESFEEGGSIFLINLPIKPSDEKLLQYNKRLNKNNKKNTFSNEKVLIAGNDKISQIIIDSILNEMGIETKIVENGIDTVNESANGYNLIIIDWHIPELNAEEVLKNIKKQNTTSKIPILVITSDTLEDFQTSVELYNEVLHKPFNKIEFVQIIKKVLHKTN